MRAVKQVILVIVAVLLLITMVQNAQPVKFRFLNWEYDVSQLLLVLIVFLIGFIAGFVTARWPRRRQDEYSPTQTQR